MSLLEPIGTVLAGAALLHLVVGALVLDKRDLRTVPTRAREALPHIGFLLGVLAVNKVAREFGPEVSWMVGWNVTGDIYRLEGALVATIQTVATPWLTTYFSATYLFGYVFVLTFPFVVYATWADEPHLERTAVAFGINYAVGLTCYVLFISYGPRNLIPDLVDPLLYTAYPQAQVVTSQVNVNTNVFPSLHTSLATTVGVQAWRTRDRAPRWAAVAIPLAASIAFSTMYLGIHWATDVVAGVVLGVGSLYAADRVVAAT